jgi:S1-C subfamily serine protease
LTDEESTIVKVVKYHHMGVVLNKLGTILVSSETVNLPHMIQNDARSPRAKRWVKEPKFSVWAIVDETGTAQELGKAHVVGTDFETGLAILQIDRTDHAYEPIPEIEPIRFQPEDRWYDPAWLAFSESYFELNDAELVARKGGHLQSRTYSLSIDRPQVSGTSAQFVECDQSQAKVGSPLFNAFGECIGLVHLIRNQQSDNVAIPSAICSRVASKLCAFGFVPRVHSPMVVSSVSQTRALPSGEEEVVRSGMYVSELRSADPNLSLKTSVFQKLVGSVILAVDGHPTPTHAEWLIALERIAFSRREQQEIELEVADGDWKSQRTIALRFQPVVRAGGAQ